jgi:hypothetical protein
MPSLEQKKKKADWAFSFFFSSSLSFQQQELENFWMATLYYITNVILVNVGIWIAKFF